MSGMAITKISPTELDDKDISHLQDVVKLTYTGTTLRHWVVAVAAGMMELFRLEGDGEGLVLTETLIHPGHKEFRVVAIAGKGLMKEGQRVLELLQGLARERGCDLLGGETVSLALSRFYERKFGMRPVSTLYIMEVE